MQCLKFNIMFKAVHIPGVHNNLADAPFSFSDGALLCPSSKGPAGHDHFTSAAPSFLAAEIGRLLSLAFAMNTHRVYMSGWHAFCHFKAHQASAVSTVSLQDIAGFISWLSLQHYSPSTINTYVAGVGCFCKLRGWADPTNNFIVAKLLEGCRRDGARQDGRLPISLSLLCRLLEALPKVCASQFESTIFRAAMLLAFFGFLRIGEFTAKSTDHMQASIQCSDVCFCGNQASMSVVLAICHSKTHQAGPPQWVHIARLHHVAICPVAALQGYLQAQEQLSGPLFCHERGDPLTRYQFTAVLRAALSFCGVAFDRYRSHSFRMGAASTAFAMGVPVADIKRSGHWRLEAVAVAFSFIVQSSCFYFSYAGTYSVWVLGDSIVRRVSQDFISWCIGMAGEVLNWRTFMICYQGCMPLAPLW